MAKFRVTERQVVEYTWEVDDTDLSLDALHNALNAVDGVPEDAHSRLVNSETSFERIELDLTVAQDNARQSRFYQTVDRRIDAGPDQEEETHAYDPLDEQKHRYYEEN